MSTTSDKSSLGHTINSVAIAFGCITIVTICLRLYGRIFLVRAVGLDDGLIVVAALLSWAFIIATLLSVHYGMGQHLDRVIEMGTLNNYANVVWLSSIFYNATLGFIKTSVLALYARLGDKYLRNMAYVMIGVVFAQAGANVLVCIFECSPIAAAWDTTITHKKCIDINAFYLANAATNIATDLITYGLPWPTVRKLQMPPRQKIAVGVMLCLGLLACVSSIVRITYIPAMLKSTDASYVISDAMYWSVIETNVGILAASIPSMKVVVTTYLPKVLSNSSNPSRNRNPTGIFSNTTSSGFNKLSSTTRTKAYELTSELSGVKTPMVTDITAVDHTSDQQGHNGSEEEFFDHPGQPAVHPWNGGIMRTTVVSRTEEIDTTANQGELSNHPRRNGSEEELFVKG